MKYTQEIIESKLSRKHLSIRIAEEVISNQEINLNPLVETIARIASKFNPQYKLTETMEIATSSDEPIEVVYTMLGCVSPAEKAWSIQDAATTLGSQFYHGSDIEHKFRVGLKAIALLETHKMITVESLGYEFTQSGKKYPVYSVNPTFELSDELKADIFLSMASIPMVEEPLKFKNRQFGGNHHTYEDKAFTRRSHTKGHANTNALDTLGSIEWKYIPEMLEYEYYKSVDSRGKEIEFDQYKAARRVRWYIPTTQHFYLPWNYDFRGRGYDDSNFVTLQGTEFQKASITMAKAEVLTDEGLEELLIAFANAYGMDKDEWEDRLLWAQQNVQNACSNIEEYLDDAEEPLMMRKYLITLQQYFEDPTKPIAINVFSDATASGLQMISVLLSDKQTASTCNVINVGAREDAWGLVSSVMNDTTDRKFERKNVKKGTMVMLYAAGEETQVANINATLDHPLAPDEIEAYSASIKQNFPAAVKFMNEIQSLYEENLFTEATVNVPDGFRSVIEVRNKKTKQFSLTLANKRIKPTFMWKEQGINEFYRGLTANLCHISDGYVMRSIVETGKSNNIEVACIHDDYTSHPNNIRKVRQWYREELAEINDSNMLNDMLKDIFGEENLITKTGDLKSEDILQSIYSLS